MPVGRGRECTNCGTGLRPLFTSLYCPNERCGMPPSSSAWRLMLPKLPEPTRRAAEERGSTGGGITWYAYDLVTFVGSLWVINRDLSYDDLLRSNVALRVNPDGSLNVIKNRHGGCDISAVPDA